jgi:trimethylamine---corrinoid protein Co-methyltransferase
MNESKTAGGRSGRDARVRARTNPAPVYLPTLDRRVGPIDLLDQDGVDRIHNAAMTILETTGIEFRDTIALAD